MTDDRSLERAARSFIEPGPTRAPEAAVERALLLIETTPQERDLRIPLRFTTMTTPARVAAAAVIGVLAIGGASFIIGRTGQTNVGGPSPSAPHSSPSPILSPSASATSSLSSSAAPTDYSSIKGTILMEHLGNAPDLSEMPTTDYHPERRRLYFMDPATMTGKTALEFLPNQPPSGKLNADVSPDGKQVVFMDAFDPAQLWIANIDGTGLRKLSPSCSCDELDPAFDPTGTKIAFVHIEGAHRHSLFGANGAIEVSQVGDHVSWLGIRDLTTGKVTKLDHTVGSSVDAIPEQPSWSPDGKKIVFNRTTWGSGDVPEHGVLQIVDLTSGKVTSLTAQMSMPGDADWSPDGSRILYTHYPWSSMGSIAGLPASELVSILPDGTDLVGIPGGVSGSWMPDGRILFQGASAAGGGYFWIMNGDGSDARPVNLRGDSLTDLPQGFAYIPHWIAAAP
jgi:WD40-like Beta Propeller Repeat